MSEVLILRLDLDTEVSVYMESEGVSLDKALKDLELYTYEAVTTELEIADKNDLGSFGTKGKDYILVKRISQLEKYEYEQDDVLNELNLDIRGLKKLGVSVDDSEDYEDE